MNEKKEDAALALLFANTKRKKRYEDLLTIAQACDFLVKLYGSKEVLAKKIGISSSMVRQLLAPLKLSNEIQLLIKNREIDSIEIVNHIATIKDPIIQLSFIRELGDLNSNDSRDIKRIIKNLKMSTDDAKKTILNNKKRKIHFFIIDLDDFEYNLIIKKSRESGIDPASLVKTILIDRLKQDGEIK
jgi:hypothetical protein